MVERDELIELITEVPSSDVEYYVVKMIRDLSFNDLVYRFYVYYHNEELQDGGELVGGTVTIEHENGLETLVKSRKTAYDVHNVIVKELLAYVHLERKPESTFLTNLAKKATLQELRDELEEQYWIVIE